jgi:hypothetical protein
LDLSCAFNEAEIITTDSKQIMNFMIWVPFY